jgi:hypothetical protein
VPFVFAASPRNQSEGETEMGHKIGLALILIALFSVTALAETKSDGLSDGAKPAPPCHQ